MMGFLERINYMKHAKAWIGVSIALTIAGLIAFGWHRLNFGIDFTGGSLIVVEFKEHVDSAKVREAITPVLVSEPTIQQAAGSNEFVLRTEELKEKRTPFMDALKKAGEYTLKSEDQVSASVSSELAWTGILSVAIAGALQILYLAFRFQYRFGVTAVVALLHDIVITIGLVAIFRVPVNAPFVAAILTILGYSINDTVIVFDRIRENLKSRKKSETLAELTTRSIQETMHRSIYTIVSVQIALVALLVWGGSSIFDMAITLLMGVTLGMYSSVFIAAALWLFWQERVEKLVPKVGAGKTVKA